MKNFYFCFIFGCLLVGKSAFAQVPILNSYPSAKAVIFIDVDGQTINGTSWNDNGPLVLAPANLSSTQVTEVFNRVAEDYRPFNVNITTDSTKYWAAPATQRIRMILTTTSDWYGNAGGVAFLNSFTWGDNTPAFVFTALLGYNAKNVAEATSHEAGHALGLRHQASYDNCVKTSEYNSGAGVGEIGWAPIMGVGYSRNLTQWNNGANPLGCKNIQDDLALITSEANGFGYRADDYSNTTMASAPITFTGGKAAMQGVIETNNDVDVLNFNVPVRGHVKFTVSPYSVGSYNNGSNLDIQLELINSAGDLIGTYNPANSLSASIDTSLSAGVYYLRIRGMGNANAPQYASLGSYTVDATFSVVSTLPLHKLDLTGKADRGNHNFSWEIIADEMLVYQSVEVSTDGRTFKPVQSLTTSTRNFSYKPDVGGPLYYRLNVKFDDGKQYYSNTVMLKSEAVRGAPSLLSNVVWTDLKINSPGAYNYAVVNLKGQIVAKGLMNSGISTIPVAQLQAGMYILQIADNSTIVTQKFIKQ